MILGLWLGRVDKGRSRASLEGDDELGEQGLSAAWGLCC